MITRGLGTNELLLQGFGFSTSLVEETSISEEVDFQTGGSTTQNTLDSNNRAEFTIPVDYYTETLILQAVSYANDALIGTNPAPSDKKFIGKTYGFKFVTSGGVVIETLNEPITIIFYYSNDNVSGIQESTLSPYRWNGSSWDVIAGYTLDAPNNTITFSTTAFSPFGILGSPSIGISGGGSRGRRRRFSRWTNLRRKKKILDDLTKRSEAATLFIDQLEEKIMETGIVKNTHKDYNPRTNKRFKVSEKQAARVAYSIAKKEGYRVGKYRGPNE